MRVGGGGLGEWGGGGGRWQRLCGALDHHWVMDQSSYLILVSYERDFIHIQPKVVNSRWVWVIWRKWGGGGGGEGAKTGGGGALDHR